MFSHFVVDSEPGFHCTAYATFHLVSVFFFASIISRVLSLSLIPFLSLRSLSHSICLQSYVVANDKEAMRAQRNAFFESKLKGGGAAAAPPV